MAQRGRGFDPEMYSLSNTVKYIILLTTPSSRDTIHKHRIDRVPRQPLVAIVESLGRP